MSIDVKEMFKRLGLASYVNISLVICVTILSWRVFLFNQELEAVRIQHEGFIAQSLHIALFPGFWTFFFLGIAALAALAAVSYWMIRDEDEAILAKVVFGVINLSLLILLIVLYSNPIFTTAAAIIGSLFVTSSLSSS